MISNSTKTKFLEELERTGIVQYACVKLGIARATYYRWRKESKEFEKRSDESVKVGRENTNDMVEQALLGKARDGDLAAIKYFLSHNHPSYKSSESEFRFKYEKVKDPEENRRRVMTLDELEAEAEDDEAAQRRRLATYRSRSTGRRR